MGEGGGSAEGGAEGSSEAWAPLAGGSGASSSGDKQPTARVVGVIKRNWRTRGYCGSLKPSERPLHGTSSVLFMPVERRYPMIR